MVSRSWKYPALWLLASFASHASRKLNRVWEFDRKFSVGVILFQFLTISGFCGKPRWRDVLEGSTVGPFSSEDEVSEFLSCSDEIPT